MKKINILFIIIILSLFCFQSSSLAIAPPSYERGEIAFIQSNCMFCHSIDGSDSGIAPDLLDIPFRYNAKTLRKWFSEHLFEEPRLSMFAGLDGPTEQQIVDLMEYLRLVHTK